MHMISLFQIIVTAFALFALSRVILRAKDNVISKKEALVWSGIWVLVIALAYFSNSLSFLEELGGARRPLDVLLTLGLIFLFYLNFRLYVKLDQVRSEITQIVREKALGKKK